MQETVILRMLIGVHELHRQSKAETCFCHDHAKRRRVNLKMMQKKKRKVAFDCPQPNLLFLLNYY